MFSGVINPTMSLDLSGWNTSNVDSMRSMFIGAHLDVLNLSNWDLSNVSDMANLFSDLIDGEDELYTTINTIYLDGWELNDSQDLDFGVFSAPCTIYARNCNSRLINRLNASLASHANITIITE